MHIGMLETFTQPLFACAICGGAVDDVVMLVGSGVGLTGLAIGFELAFIKASRAFGWQLGDEAKSSGVSPSTAQSDETLIASDLSQTPR
jgi:hypothetical protein